MAMNIDFTGKTVLVTGGGRGLGKEMALQFAGCGANVYIANRKEDQGLATVKEIEALGMVKGTVVQSKNFGKDFMAGMKTLVGGEITGYTEMLNEARQIAVKRMVDEAEALGADAVINVRYGSSSVMQGAAEVIAYGTAVKYK